jgi:hypothetical protein
MAILNSFVNDIFERDNDGYQDDNDGYRDDRKGYWDDDGSWDYVNGGEEEGGYVGVEDGDLHGSDNPAQYSRGRYVFDCCHVFTT